MKPRHLFLSWAAYWTGLIAVKLGPAVQPFLKAVSHQDGKGSVSAGFSGGKFNVSISEAAVTTWHVAAAPLSIALWLAVPPLLLWFVWLLRRPEIEVVPKRPEPQQVNGGDTSPHVGGRDIESVRTHRFDS